MRWVRYLIGTAYGMALVGSGMQLLLRTTVEPVAGWHQCTTVWYGAYIEHKVHSKLPS